MRRSDAEMKKIVSEVTERIRTGEDRGTVYKSIGISSKTIWSWRKKFGLVKSRTNKSLKPFVESIPLEPEPSRSVALVIGSPEAIAELMKARGL